MNYLKMQDLAKFVPYGLSVKTESGDVKVVNGIKHSYFILNDKGQPYEYPINRCTPNLKPLSQLTEEITVGDETFVPAFSLGGLKKGIKYTVNDTYDNGAITRSRVTFLHPDTMVKICVDTDDIGSAPHSIVEKLIEWQFDVDGILEK